MSSINLPQSLLNLFSHERASTSCFSPKLLVPVGLVSLGLVAFRRWKRLGQATEEDLALLGQSREICNLPERNARFMTTLQVASVPAPLFIRPLVILIHGFGCCAYEWAPLLEHLNDLGLDVFTFDRILFAQASAERTTTVIVSELQELLRKRNLDGPFLVVGHSYGGLIAQCFAEADSRVLGLVLIDPAHPDQFKELPGDFTLSFKTLPLVFTLYTLLGPLGFPLLLDRFSLFNFPPIFLMDSARRATVARLYSSSSVWWLVWSELVGCYRSFALPVPTLPPSMPIALLIANNRIYSPTLSPQKVTEAFLHLHQHLLRTASLRMSPSDHWIHLEQPKLVSDAVQEVLLKLNKPNEK